MHAQEDFFALFSLPPSIDLDTEELTRRYQTRMMSFHPDQFAQKSQAERLTATEMSARINHAYRILKNKWTRAYHMVALSMPAPPNYQDTTFLEEQLALQEHCQNLMSTENIDSLKQQHSNLCAITNNLYITLDHALHEKNQDATWQAIHRLSYYEKLINTITQYLQRPST